MMRPLSVLGIVSYRIFPAQMGGQKCVAGFYQELARHAKVTLAVAHTNKNAGADGLDVNAFLFDHWKGLLNIAYLLRLRKLVRRRAVDLIIIEHSYFGWLGLTLRRLTKKPLVIRSHNIESHRFRDMRRWWWWLYERYEKRVHRRADHCFFITEEDLDWAVQHWGLSAARCSVMSYGIDISEPVSAAQRAEARNVLQMRHLFPSDERLFFFNGSLDYLPNIDALRIIVTELIPLLRSARYAFRVIICGKGLSSEWINVLRSYREIIYAGFVSDIQNYWYGTDCFINPVTLGGGIRIKLVEALAHGLTTISTISGARGVPVSVTGDKQQLVNDYDWPSFAQQMMRADLPLDTGVSPAFLDRYSQANIVRRALLSLQTL
ncbi:MAG: glycosyltransferase family 4 protein [Chitinophagaceae bacterium]|nr:glycosyltransferase family 4 protein [Chitinophagaceae bacterium]